MRMYMEVRVKHMAFGRLWADSEKNHSKAGYRMRHVTQRRDELMQSSWQKAPHFLHMTMALRLQWQLGAFEGYAPEVGGSPKASGTGRAGRVTACTPGCGPVCGFASTLAGRSREIADPSGSWLPGGALAARGGVPFNPLYIGCGSVAPGRTNMYCPIGCSPCVPKLK